MYIYLIKYYDEVIAVAENDEQADKVIIQYMLHNKDMKKDMFEKVPIRFFKGEN